MFDLYTFLFSFCAGIAFKELFEEVMTRRLFNNVVRRLDEYTEEKKKEGG